MYNITPVYWVSVNNLVPCPYLRSYILKFNSKIKMQSCRVRYPKNRLKSIRIVIESGKTAYIRQNQNYSRAAVYIIYTYMKFSYVIPKRVVFHSV